VAARRDSHQDGKTVIDLDATLVIAHSDKEDAAKTWKKTFGFHPLLGCLDHDDAGTGEPLAGLLRRGNAGSNTAADHVTVLDDALAQLPAPLREPDSDGKVAVLMRTDAAGATHTLTRHIHTLGMEFSVGAYLHHFDIHTALRTIPKKVWTPAYNADGKPRDGAWLAEATGLVDLTDWPQGTRLILRKERPHPGSTVAHHRPGWPAGHRVPHQHRARWPRPAASRSGTTPPPARPCRGPHPRGQRHWAAQPAFTTPRKTRWLEICALAADLIAWTQRLALTGAHRLAEPKRLRLRLFGVAGRMVTTGRRLLLKIPAGLALGRGDHRRPQPAGRPRTALTRTPRPDDPGSWSTRKPAERAVRRRTARRCQREGLDQIAPFEGRGCQLGSGSFRLITRTVTERHVNRAGTSTAADAVDSQPARER
jgi:hypothetical protein